MILRYDSTESETLQPTPSLHGIPPKRGWGRVLSSAGWVLSRFLYARRAAGTALTAAMLTLMCLAGIAFASDHVWLVYQRDLLKAATDAASVAATKALPTLPPDLKKKGVKRRLLSIVERYTLANLPEGYRDPKEIGLKVEVVPDRAAGTVNVSATANLGGALFGTWLWGTVVSQTEAGSKTERVESILEVALAIDITGSMKRGIGERIDGVQKTQLEAVQDAANTLIDMLTNGAGNSVAIGLVPWNDQVTLNLATRTHWQDNSLAQYPASVYYPDPGGNHPGVEQNNLPPRPEVWKGCVEQRQTSGSNPPPGLSAAPPTSAEPFTMGFYSAVYKESSVSFECDVSKGWTVCYAGCAQDSNKCGTLTQESYEECYEYQGQRYCHSLSGRLEHLWPQAGCMPTGNELSELPPIQPLTTDIATIKSSITTLEPIGDSTYSTFGVVWGHRLLAPTWRSAWGNPQHPVDPGQYPSAQKALVLLTDGTDTYPVYTAAKREEHRQTACKAARDAGIKVFVIGVGNLPRASLTQCSSQADDPSGEYLFLYRNATAENLKAAFQSIGRRLIRFRRVS